MEKTLLPIRPKSQDYQLILDQFLNQLEKSRFPKKPSDMFTIYEKYAKKNNLTCKVLEYWRASGDNFGLPPELSIMLIKDSRFIRLEYNAGRDVYYDSKFKKLKVAKVDESEDDQD